MFDSLIQTLRNAQNLDDGKAWFFSVDETVKHEIIMMNTEDQLEEHGIDSMNVSLGEYALFTKAEKIEKGQRYDHVTLKDTGAFYDSFKITVSKTGFIVEADDVAFYDRPLTLVYGLDILGLTNENKAFLTDFLIENYQNYVRRTLLP